jgi:hypothetical protein
MPDEKPFRREELPKVGWIMSKLTKNISKLFFSISPSVQQSNTIRLSLFSHICPSITE